MRPGDGDNDADLDFEKALEAYLEPPVALHPRLAGVRVEWVEDDERLGALHMQEKHSVTKEEVEQVLFEIPPWSKPSATASILSEPFSGEPHARTAGCSSYARTGKKTGYAS